MVKNIHLDSITFLFFYANFLNISNLLDRHRCTNSSHLYTPSMCTHFPIGSLTTIAFYLLYVVFLSRYTTDNIKPQTTSHFRIEQRIISKNVNLPKSCCTKYDDVWKINLPNNHFLQINNGITDTIRLLCYLA